MTQEQIISSIIGFIFFFIPVIILLILIPTIKKRNELELKILDTTSSLSKSIRDESITNAKKSLTRGFINSLNIMLVREQKEFPLEKSCKNCGANEYIKNDGYFECTYCGGKIFYRKPGTF